MLITYDVETNVVVGAAMFHLNSPDEEILPEKVLSLQPVELPEGQAYFHIFDSAKIYEYQHLIHASKDRRTGGFQMQVTFDDEGNPAGIERKPE